VVEQRNHIGGLCHDGTDDHGVLIPSYGPHWFRTNSSRVRNFLLRFTAWHDVAFKVLVWADGRYWSFPINLETFEQYLGHPSTTAEMEAAISAWRIPDAHPRNSEAFVLSRVGRPFFRLFYQGYTLKQWGLEASSLLPSACGRIPIRTDRDDRYLTKAFQAMPLDGYTRMFERLLDHPGIKVLLSTSLKDVRNDVGHRHLVYTGPIDSFFNYATGALPWRSLRWERQSFPGDFVMPAMQVNYPDEHDFTRIIEPKHATGQQLPYTTILREYPLPFADGLAPFYAVPTAQAVERHKPYAAMAASTPDVTFLGRFAEYRNLDMDQVIERALGVADRLGQRLLDTREGANRIANRMAGQVAGSSDHDSDAAKPLRRKLDPKEPPAAIEIDLVVARYRETVDWLRNTPSSARITVYDKRGDLDPRRLPWARVERLENVGNEAHAYLHHLVTHYDRLAPVTFFCQGHPFDHAWDLHPTLRNVAAGRDLVDGFRWLGSMIDTDDPRGRRLFVPWSKNIDGRELALDGFHRALFGEDAPDRIVFTLGGQFAITERLARSRPRDFYRRALDLAASFPDAAHCFERLWDRVFGVTGVDLDRLGGAESLCLRPVRHSQR
jgi:UDP-galactopyranose mutase